MAQYDSTTKTQVQQFCAKSDQIIHTVFFRLFVCLFVFFFFVFFYLVLFQCDFGNFTLLKLELIFPISKKKSLPVKINPV